ncbi:MAG: SRPBCC domain-containing protein, partial [Bacteroidota bacterium]
MNKTTFTENLEDNQLIATRQFNAPVEKVWKAWSNKEFLCQWWAPAPYVCEILSMDFKEGGYWMYTMTGPEGDVYRGRMDYLVMKELEVIEAE